MRIDILFGFAAIHVNGERAADVSICIEFTFTDYNETWTSGSSALLNARKGSTTDA